MNPDSAIAKKNTATLIGATGLIGGHLLELLLRDTYFKTIRTVVRRPVSFNHPKLDVRLIDFDDEAAFKSAIAGSNAVFCAVGTTSRKVKGNKEAYRKVDYDIPVRASKFCAETGCPRFLLVSSIGANSKSGNFYLQLKGEVEDAVKGMTIAAVSIFRPSMLLGKRQEFRPGEKIGQAMMKVFSFLLPSHYKPIAADDVARAMVAAGKKDKPGFHIYQYKEIMHLSRPES